MTDVRNVLSRFANTIDLKDWDVLQDLMCDDIEIDYSDIGGYHGWVSSQSFVKQRREALASMKTHHQLSNPEIVVNGSVAHCRASAVIYRQNDDGFCHSHVIYDFVLAYFYNCWRIQKIRQQVLWNEEKGLEYPVASEIFADI